MEKDFLLKAILNKNVKAFLTMIAASEGCDASDGYNYLFGSTKDNDRRFTDFKDHPRKLFPFQTSTGVNYSDAAGRYQILSSVYDDLCSALDIHDFSPASQDLMAMELISRANSVQKIIDGNIMYALNSCSKTWASLPGANYGQPTNTVKQVVDWYLSAGGDKPKDITFV